MTQRYVSPYIEKTIPNNGIKYVRYIISGSEFKGNYCIQLDTFMNIVSYYVGYSAGLPNPTFAYSKSFGSLNDAKQTLDNYLSSNSFKLLTQEQYEKVRLLQ